MDELGTPEAAASLGLTEGRIRQPIGEGKLRATKVGRDWRIRRDNLERFYVRSHLSSGSCTFHGTALWRCRFTNRVTCHALVGDGVHCYSATYVYCETTLLQDTLMERNEQW
jgi:excisionase family DNA binding protein